MTETRTKSTDEELLQTLAASSDPADVFRSLSAKKCRRLFFQLPDSLREQITTDLSREELEEFVRHLDSDEATDVLNAVDEKVREEILSGLNERRREKVKYLLEFHPDSAGGIMTLDFVTVDADADLSDASERVRRFEERTGRLPDIFVQDDGELVGQLPPEVLALAGEKEDPLTEYLRDVPFVRPDDPDERIVEVFESHPDRTIAVVDDEQSIIGVIHGEDLLKVIEESAGRTLYEFTGVAEEESVLDGPVEKIKRRYRWLILNLATAFLAAGVVGLFEETIAAFTLLAVYMPIVAGMGGNAGTQSMAVTVRGISLDQVSLSTGFRVVMNEIIAGAANGAITGVLVALIASVFNKSPLFGLILAVSMVLNLVIAGLFGALIPLILDQLKFDPATSATIFITTATDVLGFFIFLWLARVML